MSSSSGRSKTAGLFGAATGVLAAGVGVGLAVERYLVGRRRRPDPALDEPFGARRGKPVIVTATDGLELYAEVDGVRGDGLRGDGRRGDGRRGDGATGRGREGPAADSPLTVVFSHGYALNLDTWHFQRRAFAGRVRMVFYDQRSHGRSGRSDPKNCTIDQLGEDLARVIEEVAPDGPLVLIGHSMGGMSIMAYAAHHPEEFDSRVVGVALLATSAGDMKDVTLGVPGLVGKLVNRAVPAFVATLSRAPDLVEHGRKAGSDVGFLLTKRYSFASKVPPARVEFIADMLAATPIDVVAEFFPMFGVHDKYDALERLAKVDVVIMCGVDDLITPVEHSRQIARRLPSADYIELKNCGHMLCIEYPDVVNNSLRELLDRAEGAVEWEAAQ